MARITPSPPRDFAGYAQEFLRRNSAYRETWRLARKSSSQRKQEIALPWGLAFPV